jgi:hypothetical protein
MKFFERKKLDGTRWRLRLASIGTSMAIAVAAIGSALTPSVSKAELGGILYIGATGSDVGRPSLAHDFPTAGNSIFSNISSQPQAYWVNGYQSRKDIASYVHAALARGEIPVVVVYNLYLRDCNQASVSSATAPKNPAEYLQWVSGTPAAGIADGINQAISEGIQSNDVANPGKRTPVLVMLEPDSMGLAPTNDFTNAPACWKNGQPLFDFTERAQTVAKALSTLATAAQLAPVCDPQQDGIGRLFRPTTCNSWQSQVKVYLDAAHSRWTYGWPTGEIVRRLDLAGMASAVGFFTNASNYRLVGDEAAYGQTLANALNAKYSGVLAGCGAHPCAYPPKTQVIDSGRSGADVSTGLYILDVDGIPDIHLEYQTNNWPLWCDNQKGRIGHAPTTHPNYWPELSTYGQLDALLWIKPPGETDGCWGGAPSKSANTLPAASTMYNDQGTKLDSDKTAGWASWYLACGLVEGAYYSPIRDHLPPTLCSNGYNQSIIPPPLAPTDVRISDFTMVAWGAAADTITLEWEPSRYSCAYMISARTSTDNRNWSGWRQVNGNYIGPAGYGMGAPTRFVISPVHGRYVQYGVRARKCDDVGTTYSGYGYSARSTAVVFP